MADSVLPVCSVLPMFSSNNPLKLGSTFSVFTAGGVREEEELSLLLPPLPRRRLGPHGGAVRGGTKPRRPRRLVGGGVELVEQQREGLLALQRRAREQVAVAETELNLEHFMTIPFNSLEKKVFQCRGIKL